MFKKIFLLFPCFLLFTGLFLLNLSPAMAEQEETAKSSKYKVLILAETHIREGKLKLFRKLSHKSPYFNVDYKYVKNIEEGTSLKALLAPYDLVMLDAISAGQAVGVYKKFHGVIGGDKKFISVKNPKLNKLTHGFSATEVKDFYGYYRNGGTENLNRLVVFLEKTIFKTTSGDVKPPILFPSMGIYHPDYKQLIFADLKSYLKWKGAKEGQAVIGLAISREGIAADDTKIEDYFIREIEQRGAVAVPFYFQTFMPDQMIKLLQTKGKTNVDAIINLGTIHMAEARRKDYEKLGVSVLQTIPYRAGTIKDWEVDVAGIPAMATPFFLTLSEIAGTIDPVVVSADGKNKERLPITYQVKMVIDKAVNLAGLKSVKPTDKKLAIMFYSYPSGEKNASASFLNVPRSLMSIAHTLKTEGYDAPYKEEQWYIDRVGEMQRPLMRGLSYEKLKGLGEKGGAGGLLAVSKYRIWYDKLPIKLRQSIESEWGTPEEAFTVVDKAGVKYFAVPRVISGNIMILPQPPRGNNKGREKSIYHDKMVPISHNFLAVYFYAREEFGADALMHLGTHGSHEYLPGKERGLSRYDAGNLAIGDLPVIYPFIMDDVGEALQTKRRGRAVVISHLTPPLVKAGLYEEITDLHNLMHEYNDLDQGGVKNATQKQIIDLVIERNIHQDMGWEEAKILTKFKDFMMDLHDYIGELGSEVQPLGLHTYGEVPLQDHLTSTIVQMLGRSYSEPALKEGRDYLEPLKGKKTPSDKHDNEFVSFERLKDSAEFRLVDKYTMKGGNIDEIKQEELKKHLIKAREHYENFKNSLENQSLIKAMKGEYIIPSTGGDPIRSPAALPSGRNLYGFDPSKIPSKAAWETGKKLTADLISDFHQRNGRFPDKLTFSLWSIETMRHHGVIESQVLYAMGTRPIWDEGGTVSGTEVIPYADLKRPRVDVVMSATGLYRDALSNLMIMMAKAIEQVAALKEDNNYIYQNTTARKAELIKKGFDEEEAATLSTLRIFSNQSGTYGTGVADAAMASDTWEKDDKLAKLYLSRMGYAFGTNTKLWGKKYDKVDLYADNLSGTDAAVFSRSSNVYGLLTSDDPFQYMGGISLAVRSIDGTSPEMFISNLRNPQNTKIETLGKFLSKELRTRYFHPQWIKAIQDEGYAGTLAILDVTNNFWGWQVVDPENVRDDQWQDFFEVYVNDKYDMDMKEWFEKSNPHALAQMIERMMEANRKEYWETDKETLKKLTETYIELASKYDVMTKNKKFTEFVDGQAAGFGLMTLSNALSQAQSKMKADMSSKAAASSQAQQVEGQKLEKQEKAQEIEQDYQYLYLLLLMFIAFAGGMFYQSKRAYG